MIESLKNFAELAALGMAALYFGYKFFAGYFRLNLSMSVSHDRQESNEEGFDDLAIRLVLMKGNEGTLELHDVQARVIVNDKECYYEFPGVIRSAYVENSEEYAPARRAQVDWKRAHPNSSFIKMTPDEQTELGLHCRIASSATCNVTVVVAGRKIFSKSNPIMFWMNPPGMGQWKVSTVSLPILR